MGARIIKNNQEYKQTDADFEIYSDFDHSFFPNPFTKQLTRKTNESSVAMALRNLLLTNKYERRRNPNFGSTISKYLFENFSPSVLGEVEDRVRNTIKNNEPRVRIIELNVTTNEQENELRISILFSTVSAPQPERLNITLYRVR
jgi:uncharacterized protein